MDEMSLSDEYGKNGYVVIKSLFSKTDVDSWRDRIIQRSGITEKDFNSPDPPKWTSPSGPSNDEVFFNAILNKNLIESLNEIFGQQVKYLHHNDLHAGFGAHGYHRDSVFRGTTGLDFDESNERYQVCRVAAYLQTFEESGFKFGIVPGSHKKTSFITRLETSRPISSLKRILNLPELIFTKQKWITVEPGDAIIFDTRCWHRGGVVKGPKYSFFIGFGIQNSHFNRHWSYYSDVRKDLNYSSPDEKLVQLLKEQDLWPDRNIDDGGGYEGAFIPQNSIQGD